MRTVFQSRANAKCKYATGPTVPLSGSITAIPANVQAYKALLHIEAFPFSFEEWGLAADRDIRIHPYSPCRS